MVTDFSKRNIRHAKTLGERLRRVREEANISLQQAETDTGIQKKYLRALEESEYTLLPGPVYVESFLKRYARYLKVSEEFVLNIYRDQERRVLRKKYQPSFSADRQKMPRAIITPRLLRNIGIGMVALVCLIYILFEMSNIFAPPDLAIANPPDYITIQQDVIEVKGTTNPEASVTINGELVYLDPEGFFSEEVDLKSGINTITISAKKKRSKATVIERHILYETPNK